MRQSECRPHSDAPSGPDPFPIATLAPELCCLGFRLVETALAVPFVIAGTVLAATKPRFCYGEHCRERPCHHCGRCEHKCRCGHEKHRHHGSHHGHHKDKHPHHHDCGHHGHHDDRGHHGHHDDCGHHGHHDDCGHHGHHDDCGHHGHHDDCGPHGTADIKIHARVGDVRHKVILVQNNGPKPVTVTMSADPWTDCSKKSNATGANPTSSITFTPPTLTIAPCEALETVAQINVAPPLVAGETYFTQVHLQGCAARPILIELCVESQNRIDYCAHTDPCRRRHDKYVDVCCDPCDPCHPSSKSCGHHHPWHWQSDPWRWIGPDPHRFWYGPGGWERFWVASGKPCC